MRKLAFDKVDDAVFMRILLKRIINVDIPGCIMHPFAVC